MNSKEYKPYNPKDIEDRIYALWEESGYFNPDVCVENGVTDASAESFSIVLPPPNVTGNLHTGHALMLAIEDALIRYNRMRGKKTLWLPGTDHAAIATQSKVEKILKEKGITRYDLGREKFLERVEKYAQESHDNIVNQLKKMGSSLDWSREAYTLDEKREIAVKTAFKRMYDAGLIFRGDRIVNWDPKGQTTVSDDEVVHEDVVGKLYTFKYSRDFPISIATTRPETKVGDTAVAVHPDDDRYREYVGKTFEVDFIGVPLSIKVIAEEEVDKEYGTGAVGLTPAHSQIDWEIAERHGLEKIQVIDEKAQMIIDSPDLNGKTTTEAREIIVEKLEKEGLLEKTEEIEMSLSKAERSGGVIEPLPKLQWFVSVNSKFKVNDTQRVKRADDGIDPEPAEGSRESKLDGIKNGDEVTLKELMKAVVESGQIEILPERFKKTYFHWIDNLRDWCISRQIWFGHRVPVWYCRRSEVGDQRSGRGCPKFIVSVGIVESCPNCGGAVEQDPDTLDTWFSSGLWTFSTLGWPFDTAQDKPSDLETYHPTSVLETGYDILFFWVARMILMSTFHLGEIPFETVYLHGLIRDEKGRKMSKSLDNIVDPLEKIEDFGADALRLAMVYGVGVGNDQNLMDEKIKGMRNFANKIFNIARFIQMNIEGKDVSTEEPKNIEDRDREIIKENQEIVRKVTELMEECRISQALQITHDFVWNKFASEYMESVKDRLKEDSASALAARYTLTTIFLTQLKLLHPFMPFLTEDLYQEFKISLPGLVSAEYLMVEEWPEQDGNF